MQPVSPTGSQPNFFTGIQSIPAGTGPVFSDFPAYWTGDIYGRFYSKRDLVVLR